MAATASTTIAVTMRVRCIRLLQFRPPRLPLPY